MANRNEQKERLRVERQEQEEAAARREARSRAIRFALAALVVCSIGAGAVALALSGGGEDPPPASVSGIAADGFLKGPPPWPPEYDNLGARLAGVSFPPVGDESFHVHALLSVFVNGEPVTVPPNVGLGPAIGELSLHTHTPDGVVHIEADDPYPFTVGQFFDVWGVKLTDTRLGPFENSGDDEVQAFVNGKAVQDLRSHQIADKDNIVVGYGKAGSFPVRPDAGALDAS